MLKTLRDVLVILVAIAIPFAMIFGILYLSTGEVGLAYNLSLPIGCIVLWLISKK